jgi:sterol desaturase/sphingolipid hydroxylase (fatty acid hydroxylase superfamily)
VLRHFAVAIIFLTLLGAIFSLLERWSPAHPRQPRMRDGMLTDLGYALFVPPLTRALGFVGIALVAIGLALLEGMPLGPGVASALLDRSTLLGSLPVVAQAVLVLLAADFLGYWAHRAFHRGALWRVHAVHHSSRELDWLSSIRAHPLNPTLTRMFQVVVLVGVGFDPRVVAGVVPILLIHGVLLHANVSWSFGPLRYVVASPAFHRWHHAADREGLDRNFAGLFPIWDLMFGTFHLPRDRFPERYGIRGERLPPGVLAQLAYPFRRRSAAEGPFPPETLRS